MLRSGGYAEGLVSVKGYKLHYLEWGKVGNQIIALHSMGMDGHAFDSFSEALAKEHRILAIDLLGHGESDAPKGPVSLEEHAEIIRGVALDRGFRKSTLVGHSIGGSISMVYAAEYPAEVDRVVLVDIAPMDLSAPRRGPPPSAPPEFFESQEEALKYFKTRYPGFTDEALQNRVRFGLKRGTDGRLRLTGKPESLAMLRGSLQVDLWPFVSRIAAPTLLVIGSESQVVSETSLARMRQTLKSLDVVIVKGATHMVPQDHPKEFLEAVRSFLKKK